MNDISGMQPFQLEDGTTLRMFRLIFSHLLDQVKKKKKEKREPVVLYLILVIKLKDVSGKF